MKETRLKPKFDASHNAWRLSIPANLSDTGKRRNLFYATKKEAEVKADQLKARKDNYGILLAGALSPAQISEASEAYNILSGISVSLLDAVKSYVAEHRMRNQSVTLEELFNQFIA